MIHTYYMDVTQFEDKDLFQEKLESLSPYRQQKILQLKQEADRRRSLGAGLVLDHALRIYGNGLRERDMEYVLGEWGKPSLREYPEIHFSLSHSGAYAMCSIGGSPVGNDVERVRTGRLKVAERFFTAQELAFLYSGQDESVKKSRPNNSGYGSRNACEEEEEIVQRMFRIWTMKESFLKVTGRGMTLSLKDFSVIVEKEGDKVLVEHCFDAAAYHMKEYADIPGYRAAVCYLAEDEIAENMKRVLF